MLRIVPLITFLMITSIQVEAQENNLSDKVSFKADKIPLELVLQQLARQYSLHFFYSPNKIPLKKLVTIEAVSMPFPEFMRLLCGQSEIGYSIENEKIILFPNETDKYNELFTIFGYATDSLTGERLIGATIFFPDLAKGVATNDYGYYSFTLPKGNFRMRCSYIGYMTLEKSFVVKENEQFNIPLPAMKIPIREIKLTAKAMEKISSIQVGQDEVPLSIMRNTPSLLGENDVIQFLKMMPGIVSANEASNGLFIRGSTPQQSSFALDDAPLFNLYHISGWFSTINPDALKDVKIYKNQLPVKEGGALSSLIDFRLRDGNNQKFTVTGGVGTITSRLTFEGPIVRDKASFIISGRRSYFDMLIKLFGMQKDIGISEAYFYDLNAKLNYTINQKNKLYLSGYRSQDLLYGTNGTSWGNKLLSFRWNHVVSGKLFSNFMVTGSNYKHQFQGSDIDNFSYEFTTRIRDYNCKLDFTYYSRMNHKINFGLNTNYQDLLPILYKSGNPDIDSTLRFTPLQKRLIYTFYTEGEFEINEHLGIQGGIRLALLHNLSEINPELLLRPQPSLILRYKLTDFTSVKVGYSRNDQFNHGASVFGELIPFERYLFTDAVLKPQYANHFSTGYFHKFGSSGIELSIEAYYSSMKDQYRFQYGTEIFIGRDYQSLAIPGTVKAYGIEYSLRKIAGRFTGFLNYTLAKVDRKEEIAGQIRTFNPYYDRRHNLSLSSSFDVSKKVCLSASWVFMSGNPYSLPIAKYEIRGTTIPLFDPSQTYTRRMPPYHHLDVGVQIKFAAHKHYQHRLNFSIYNVYAQRNDIFYSYRNVLDGDVNKDVNNPVYSQKKFDMVSYYLFQFLPAFSYEFKFY